MRAQFVFHEVWIGLRRNLTMTIALIVVVAISLSLLGTGLLFVKQVDNTRNYWQGQGAAVGVPVQQRPASARSAPRTARSPPTEIDADPQGQLKSATPGRGCFEYVNQTQAYQQFRQEFANNPSAGQGHPGRARSRASIEVRLKNTEADVTELAANMGGMAGVDQVASRTPPSWTSSTSCWTARGTRWSSSRSS